MKPKKLPKKTQIFSVLKSSLDGKTNEDVAVISERPFRILVNDDFVANIMLTPDNLNEFLYGFLVGQGIAKSKNQIEKTLVDMDKGILWAQVKGAKIDLTKALITSGCAGGISLNNFNDIEPLKPARAPDLETLTNLMKEMLKNGELYAKSGGIHSAALADKKSIIFQAEDIGRHNCLDKVIGYLMLNDIEPEDKIVLTTGRLSLEAVPKIARAHISTLGSRSTPTDLAVEIARKLKVNLIGYIRAGKMTVYNKN
ncbi:MAG: formate dehydrogenase accessory sulfurtransferase FdhD [Actinobacteria bacterium]|nr:MAG: formate dehydrogenase accessory sulfurtransferase FdhD [Actinomycetota bacterium]